MTAIQFNNIAQLTASQYGRDWFRWVVFVDESEETLQTIASVEYLLHPSFKDPLKERSNYQNKFALECEGWGEFQIRTTLFFKDGTREDGLYQLDLSKEWDERMLSSSVEKNDDSKPSENSTRSENHAD